MDSKSNRLSLLVLCDAVDSIGGTESYLSRVLPALGGYGVDVTILGRRVVRRRAFGPEAVELAWGADDEPARPEAARAVARSIEHLRPDVVMTSNVHDHTVMAAARTARRLIVRVHDHRLFCPQGDRQFPQAPSLCTHAMAAHTCVANAVLRGCAAGLHAKSLRLVRSRLALRDAILSADKFVVASNFVANLCALNGVARERIVTIPPPFEGEAVRVPAARPVRDRVFFAGRLVRDKGLKSLILALAAIPREARPELAVAGAATPESQPLPEFARSRGVRLQLLGRLEPAALNAEIDASTLVAVPSLWPEPFGLTGIEAQARGRPVVAYDVGGIPEWMGEAGLLAKRGDVAGFALAIRAVLDARRWPEFSAAALRQSARYRLERHLDPLVAVLAGGSGFSRSGADPLLAEA